MRKYKCPECGEENTSDQWKESTISHYHKAGYTNTSYDNSQLPVAFSHG